MEERQNRFILFPMDEEEESSSDAGAVNHEEMVQNEVASFSEKTNPSQVIPSADIGETTDDGVFSSEQPIGAETVSEMQLDSDNLVSVNPSVDVQDTTIPEDLGVVQRDANGRIIFDIPLDDTPVDERQTVSTFDDSSKVEESVPFDNPAESFSGIEEAEEVSAIEEADEETTTNAFKNSQNLQDMINQILRIDRLDPVKVDFEEETSEKIEEKKQYEEEYKEKIAKENQFRQEIYDVINHDSRKVVFKSDLLERLKVEYEKNNQLSMLVRYGEDYCSKDFVTNPAIGRENEIRELILTLLTPEKSAILIGKPGIGKTSIVEGLAYRLQRGDVPEALQGFSIVNIKTPSLIGTLANGETRLQSLVDELKKLDHIILFIDEIHMLIGATNDSAMDFANMFKEGLGRGQIKVIGATTTEEYERYILRDKAFVRRFQSIEVLEPSREHTIKILMGTLPKIEKDTGAKLKYTTFIQTEIMGFITDITSEYKRVYGIGSRYPDICLTLLKEAFSQCIFENRDKVTIFDIRNAIQNSKNIYPDVIRKELPKFDEMFKKIIDEEIADDASIDRL